MKLTGWMKKMFGKGKGEDAPSPLADARYVGASGGGGSPGTVRPTECSGEARVVIQLEPEPTQEDVKSFFAKLDEVERNVPVAMVATWKQLAAEKMTAVRSAEEFAFEQGRLAAFCEMEKAFLEMGKLRVEG